MVWLARDGTSGAKVSLTLPRAAPAGPVALDAWLTEARRAKRLAHPILATTREPGAHAQWPFVAIDRGQGVTLVEGLAGRRATPRKSST